MPFKKTGIAISRFLYILGRIAEKYGNPFILAYLPDLIEVDGKTYSKDTINRYISWIKKYYRERGRPPPITTRLVPDKIRGRVAEIHVDLERLAEEIETVRQDTGRWGHQSRGTDKCKPLRNKIRVLEKKIERLEKQLEKYKERPPTKQIVIQKKPPIDTETFKKYAELVELLRNMIAMTPDEVADCIEGKIKSTECMITRIILDKAITDIEDGLTPIDILLGMVSDEYTAEIEKIRRRIERFIKNHEKLLKNKVKPVIRIQT